MFKLVIQDDEGKTTVVPLIRDEITIGRKEGNTIRLTERNVSRRHARILRNNGEVQIEDLGSYNGIRVNNARIAERVSLRVSDQVQIGDYKLYLKAEGVEQVDDARTMPIERVDAAAHAATAEMIPAAAPAPTQPMAIQTPAPGTLPPAAQALPANRTQAAVADTDPQGRPIASAAAVAAMTAPVGYGKLVVLSSNFAGKEFELSRPQMIIGRTDENDIVINHRSISRNHAKLVRETDTGRYTISDLQSSNGVRVNGQDYGKVELRRGDVVDLGHVRLRFVEAGEDFVFSRDAHITDVPDAGGKRTLLVAVLLGVVVLVGVVAFIAMRDKPKGTNGTVNENPLVADDAATQVAAVTPDAAEIEVTPPDAAAVAVDNKAEDTRLRCREAADKQKWDVLKSCTADLKKYDQALASELLDKANREGRAADQMTALTTALRNKNLKKAAAALDQIPKDSVYKMEAESQYKAAESEALSRLVASARKAVSANCREYNRLMQTELTTSGKSVVDAAKREVGCKPEVAVVVKDPVKDPIKDPTPEKCNADELAAKGTDAFGSSQYGPAISWFEQAYKCRGDAGFALRIVLSACRSKNTGKAKLYWKRLSASQQNSVISVCIGNGISSETLNGP